MGRVLALNRDFIPIRTTSPMNCISKMYTNMAEAIFIQGENWEGKTWDEWVALSAKDIWPKDTIFFHSPTLRVAIPRIIRYTLYSKIPKPSIRLSRKAIYERDNHTCYICGKKFSEGKLSIDHVIPFALGGKNSWENMATCCYKCNQDKGHKTLAELGIRPKFMPFKPNISNMQKLKSSISTVYPEWKLFI
jgi:5-methylcytosine-specific restriction endonuclease McrA